MRKKCRIPRKAIAVRAKGQWIEDPFELEDKNIKGAATALKAKLQIWRVEE